MKNNSVLVKSIVVALILIMTLSTLGYLFKGNSDASQTPSDWNETEQAIIGQEGPEPELSCFSGDSSSTLIRIKEYLKVQSCTDSSDFEGISEQLKDITGVYRVNYTPQLSSEGDACNGDFVYSFNADLTVSKSKMSRSKDRSKLVKDVKTVLEKDFNETVVALVATVELPETLSLNPFDCETYQSINSNVTKEYELKVREVVSIVNEYSEIDDSVPVTVYVFFASTPDSEWLTNIIAFEQQRPIMRYPDIKNSVVDAVVNEDLNKIEFSGNLSLSNFMEKDLLTEKLLVPQIETVELNDYVKPQLVLNGHAVLEGSESDSEKVTEIDVNKTDELLSGIENVESVSGNVRDTSYTFKVDLNSTQNILQTIDSIKALLEENNFVDVKVQESFASVGGSASYSGDGEVAFDAFKESLDENNVTVFEINHMVMVELPKTFSFDELISEDSNATEVVDYDLEENIVKAKVNSDVSKGDTVSIDLDVYVLDYEIVGTNAEQTR